MRPFLTVCTSTDNIVHNFAADHTCINVHDYITYPVAVRGLTTGILREDSKSDDSLNESWRVLRETYEEGEICGSVEN